MGFGLCAAVKRWRKRKYLFAAAACAALLALAIWGNTLVYRSGNMNVTVLDVGQGESVALYSGGQAMLVDCGSSVEPEQEPRAIPQKILDAMGEELSLTCCGKKLYVTLGQFSIIRLERDTQLLIPAYDYCMPDKACQGSTEDDPCSMFSRIHFPIDEFFPPDCVTPDEDYSSLL